ncbi:MAG: ABC transporter [Chloroflexi bacterium HGW-Chloroflexi-8]|jgi:NitT/TauT family transport system ATP-binding protein|nr:MAG: ABC transporter [Chloroflexi bacterium HGW-Chloroflexi-8]
MSQFLQVRDLHVTYAAENGGLRALHGVNFNINQHEFVSIIGPSGSGKSTLLKVIAGLLEPTRGELIFNTQNDQPARIGFVFQQANLMPWRTVLENIMLPMEIQKIDPLVSKKKALELVELVGLDGFENTWVQDLSGGMAQRVAIARALIQEPELLLLDEPFGALDALTREQMGEELLRVWQVRKTTVLMVTHSISEALLLSDRVLVLSARPGRIYDDIAVGFPRPRTDQLRYTPAFGELSQKLKAAILPG